MGNIFRNRKEEFRFGDIVRFGTSVDGGGDGFGFPSCLYIVAELKFDRYARKPMIVIVPAASKEVQEADIENPETAHMLRGFRDMRERVVSNFNLISKVDGYVVDDAELSKVNFPGFVTLKRGDGAVVVEDAGGR